LWLAGWDCCLSAYSQIYHKYEFSRSSGKYYWLDRNRLLSSAAIAFSPSTNKSFMSLGMEHSEINVQDKALEVSAMIIPPFKLLKGCN
ncbi:MAG: hypothetical protein PHV95_09090, partial [Eubacteriales bacterium]|nr:hypothetical protein [Eubacteriales bacterium]